MTIGGDSGVNPVLVGFVCVLLVLFGVGYNKLVAWLEREKYLEGFVSISVVAGVGVTLLGLFMIDAVAGVVALLLFISSGSPMIVGSIERYVRRRKAERDAIRRGE